MSKGVRALQLRIFLASPGDVPDERAIARSVIDQTQYDREWHGLVTLQTIAWEEGAPMLASASPQASVAHALPKPSECDIVIVIFWARPGSPLLADIRKPDGATYASGTEWEYLDALESAKLAHRPRILLYRRTEEPSFRASDPERSLKLEQWEWVNRFFTQFRDKDGSFKGGYTAYETPDGFRLHLEADMRSTIHDFATARDFVPSVVLAHRPLLPEWKGSPFPGLRAFTPEDGPIFFGRGQEIDQLVRRLGEDASRFLAVVGTSGSGKSSLVAAGLLPRLQANALEGSRDWCYVRCTPAEVGDDPVLALAHGLYSMLHREDWPIGTIANGLSSSAQILADIADLVLSGRRDGQLLLFIDQLEELFTLVPSERREGFLRLLVDASQMRSIRVVVTVRADYFARCIERPDIAELLREGSYPLAAAREDSLLEMIIKPAHRAGLYFDDGLVGRILADTGSDPGALPLMAFALSQLYERRELSGRLTHEAYDAFDGVKGAIVKRAEAVLTCTLSGSGGPGSATTGSREADLFDEIFRELVAVDEGKTPTKRRAPLSRVARSPMAASLVDTLVNARLLVRGEGADPVIEVAHEALLTSWPRLGDWMEGVLDDIRLRSQLQRAAREWDERGHDATYLWSDERAVTAHTGLQRLRYLPSEVEQQFLGPLHCGKMLEELEDDATPEQRAVIGVRLALLGDPRPGIGLREDGLPEFAWCQIPGGRITGNGREVHIAPCFVSKYQVTAAQYGAFLEAADGYSDPAWWQGLAHRDEQPGRQFRNYRNHPADNVSWLDATAYCRWLSSRLGYEVRLPTEWEWQQAANGGDATKTYPWGEWETGRANTAEAQLNRTTAVGVFPRGASPVGALDMCSNVWEWCSDDSDLYEPDDNCPLGYRAIRGGSWNFAKSSQGCALRSGECSAYRFTSVGFRVARSANGSY